MDIKPLGKRVWVELDEPVEESSIIALASDDKSMTGVVKAVGPEVESLKVDDRILFPENAGIVSKVDGTEVLTMGEDEIFATI